MSGQRGAVKHNAIISTQRVATRSFLFVAILFLVGCAAKSEITSLLGEWQCGESWKIYVYKDEIASINGLKGKWTKVEADAIRLEYRESERSPERILRLAIVENRPDATAALERLRNLGNGTFQLQRREEDCTYDSKRGKQFTCLDVNRQSLACDR